MNKQEVLDIVDRLPEPIDPEQLMMELYLKAKLDRAEAAIAKEEIGGQDAVVRQSQHWFDP